MKKGLAFLLTVMMCVVFAACGETTQNNGDTAHEEETVDLATLAQAMTLPDASWSLEQAIDGGTVKKSAIDTVMAKCKVCYEQYTGKQFCDIAYDLLDGNGDVFDEVAASYDAAVDKSEGTSTVSMADAKFQLAKAKGNIAQWQVDYWNYVQGGSGAKTDDTLRSQFKEYVNEYAQVIYGETLL